MSIIAWIVLGLLAGLIAKAIKPGAEQIGLILTTVLRSRRGDPRWLPRDGTRVR